MTEYWDYFMRRKARLLPIMALFLSSSLLSYSLLRHHQPELSLRETPSTYISVPIADPEEEDSSEIDVPLTGSPDPQIFSIIMDPTEVTALAPRLPDTDPVLEPDTAHEILAPNRSSRTAAAVTLLISLSIAGGFWLYFLYEHYTR